MGRTVARMRAFLSGQLRDLPPGRRLRLRVAHAELERRFAGRDDVRLLDAGSEEGLLCLRLAPGHPGWTLVAADLAEAPLHRGLAWAQAAGSRVSFVCCDLQQPLADGGFDVVTALESLVEIPDDQAALRTLVAALRPGGTLLLQVPTADWTPVLRSAERSWRREARHGYEADALVAELEGLGLAVESVAPTFRRLVALAQDVRDRFKRRGRLVQLAMLPVMAAAVAVERAGLSWGPPRALFVVAVRR